MLIIGDNLKQLATAQDMCPSEAVEEFCLKIKLGDEYFEAKNDYGKHVIYGNHPSPSELFNEKATVAQNLIIYPQTKIIACSLDIYKMPLDHFGLVQTKGTLARLFVQTTCGDGQIEPGFHGHITLEIVNMSPWVVEIPKFSEVSQLYIFKTSTESEAGYRGRYAEAALRGPTIPIFKR